MILPDGLVDFPFGPLEAELVILAPVSKAQPKSRHKRRQEAETIAEMQVIPAPTIIWHPSVSLEKLIADFSEYRDAIIVS